MAVKIVMIIDDDADDREIFCEALQEVDGSVQCISCSSGAEGLEILNRPDQALPDFIFLDLNMPRMNGKQCLQELKQTDKLKDLPVFIYSTSKIADDVKTTQQHGAVYFITKPCSIKELRHTIRTVLSNNWSKLDSSN